MGIRNLVLYAFAAVLLTAGPVNAYSIYSGDFHKGKELGSKGHSTDSKTHYGSGLTGHRDDEATKDDDAEVSDDSRVIEHDILSVCDQFWPKERFRRYDGRDYSGDRCRPTRVPEPSSIWLLGLGLVLTVLPSFALRLHHKRA